MKMNMDFLERLLSSVSRRARHRPGRQPGREASPDVPQLAAACDTLLTGSGGEASQILVAQRILNGYDGLQADDRRAFLAMLAERHGALPEAIHAAYAAYREHEDEASLQQLIEACEPPRQELLRRLNLCPGGTYELVKMRADLLGSLADAPQLAALDADFAHLFASWFNRGFLMLESIDWNTPAAVLEKLIEYEAVHEIRDWSDLRRRLDPEDRRCYAFFHPAIGDEPLIFVEVALCRGIPGNIQTLLAGGDEVAPEDADTAVFYSISNCQAGLKGISFGNFLIKQVVQELKRELPELDNFVTLSPVPGFAKWLEQRREAGECRLSPDNAACLDEAGWCDDAAAREALEPELLALAAHYLCEAKQRHGLPRDPVARFHLGNGASLHRLNWPADTSAKGCRQAHGLMVNYRYEPDRIEQNHEAFSREGSVVCTSEIRRHAKRAQPLLAAPVDA
ncbi:malonyl-CoA decarboxylase [Halomonas organivorans]|uniref:Malonyl-CoA decarboxylase n=2 Tax=Halomonas organivorans TaxID=257772 RepID=A0A7W5C1M0_9GAMM|nr:malonyl-CoA decarboxylase [Halomonas organivorans]